MGDEASVTRGLFLQTVRRERKVCKEKNVETLPELKMAKLLLYLEIIVIFSQKDFHNKRSSYNFVIAK